MDKLGVVTVNDHTTLLIGIRSIPEVEPELFRSSPKKVLARVLILVDTNEVLGHRVDGDD